MNSFEWNKIIGAVLGTLIFVFVIKTVAEIVYEPEEPAKPGYVVEGVVEESTGAAGPVVEEVPDFGTVLASADAAKGKGIAQRCLQCHDLSPANTNKIGPGMWDVVNRPRASHPGFSYSNAMKAKGGTWTYADLFKFLKSPGADVPGTKMSFAGIRNAQDRINLIAFLRTESNSPAPIPAPAPKTEAPPTAADAATAPAAAGAAPAAAPAAAGAAPAAMDHAAPGKVAH